MTPGPPVDPLAPGARRAVLPSTTGPIVAVVATVSGVALLVSAVVEVATGGAAGVGLASTGGASLLLAVVLARTTALPARIRAAEALAAVLRGWLAMIGISTVAYVAAGAFDGELGGIWPSVFESTAGFTTTALSVTEEPQTLSRGILLWRAATQWLGGFAALAVIVAVLPFLGVGGPQPTEARAPTGARFLLSPHVVALLRRYLAVYVALTAAGVALLLTGGMSPFDALTYGMTTVSTGGFGNHRGSFGYFDSTVLEWLGAGGMVLGGASLALLWRGLRGRTGALWRSFELRVYLGILAVGTFVVWGLDALDDGVTHDGLRESAFSVASVVSTTGHYVADWGSWSFGAQTVLVVLMGVGAMSGSVGAGFRVARAVTLLSYVAREVVRQLHPRSVRVVKVGRTTIDEDLVQRAVGYQVLYLVVGGFGALGLAVFGADVLTAISGAVGAISTTGPALGDLSPGDQAVRLSGGAQAALVVVMLAGRLELYPVLVTLDDLLLWPGRVVRAGRRTAQRLAEARR